MEKIMNNDSQVKVQLILLNCTESHSENSVWMDSKKMD